MSVKSSARTIEQHLRLIFVGIRQRTKGEILDDRDWMYTDKMIFNLFVSPEEFIQYVVNELKVDPRGRACHRIDDSGHYEKGNIEFLTAQEHAAAHVKLRRLQLS